MSLMPRSLCAFFITALLSGALPAAEAPRVRSLRTQTVGEVHYFHVCFDQPADRYAPPIVAGPYTEVQRQKLTLVPRLVPQTSRAWLVYARVVLPHFRPIIGLDRDPKSGAAIKGLEFVGQHTGRGKARFLLFYPVEQSGGVRWVEVPVDLDFDAAEAVRPPAGRREPGNRPERDDLEGLWAEAQAARFAILEALAPDFSFYGFACAATGRKYGVAAPALEAPETPTVHDTLHRQLYATTTGAAAITASLQSQRLLHADAPDRGHRTVDIWKIPGIDIAEHPWKAMIGDKRPAPEPLAQWVPRDNYYICFKSLGKLLNFADLLDQWGTNVLRAYEIQSRDYDLRARYERQLCLKSTWLGKTLGPAVVRGVAITGNDPYLREGSDVTIIFHVRDAEVFLATANLFLAETRKEYGNELQESRADYHGARIESYVTPHREVSLHRAVAGEFVVYSNSPTGLRRALDAHHRRLPALADALDFQYMRTVFRADDPEEDGFAFLSDAFIRQLVGPASKIKEKRRLEALTSLGMMTNAVLFTAWEGGRSWSYLSERLLKESALKPEYLYVPEGTGVSWDRADRVAVSDAYNTLTFAAPLIELPIDKITPTEEREYLAFREEYTRLWRRYFDPVGIRLGLTDRRVKVETYILPLVQLPDYQTLLAWTGGGTTTLDLGSLSRRTLLQYTMHLNSPFQSSFLGDQIFIRLDDGPELRELADFWIRWQTNPPTGPEIDNLAAALRLALRLPLSAGVKVKDQKRFEDALNQLGGLLGREEKKQSTYRDVAITHVRFDNDGPLGNFLHLNGERPQLYHAFIDDAWYVSLREAPIKEFIDSSIARKQGKRKPRKAEQVELNTSLYLAPGAADKARGALHYYLEWESRRRALANDPLWYALYRSGLVAEDMPEKERSATALHYLGFVPVSPEGAAYRYDRKADEVVNERHGSLRVPRKRSGIDNGSPLDRLLDQFRTMRVDLRFREDGIHTTLTLERRRER